MLRRTSKFSIRNTARRQRKRATEVAIIKTKLARGYSLSPRELTVWQRLELVVTPNG